MHAIVAVESGGNPYAIHDNTTRRAYFPRSRTEAVHLLAALQSHNLDVGIVQVNAGWFPTFGVSATQMLAPCRNLRVGSVILTRAYRDAGATFRNPRLALWHAISAYNTGSLYAGAGYVSEVVNAALSAPVVPSIALLTSSPTDMPIPHPLTRLAPSPANAQPAIYHATHRNERAAEPSMSATIHRL